MKRWLGLMLLLPGGLLIALGVLAAWPGLALLVSGLRRMTAPSGDAGRADEVRTPEPMQPHGQPCQPSPRVPWAACGERGSSTGQPPAWLSPPSREVH